MPAITVGEEKRFVSEKKEQTAAQVSNKCYKCQQLRHIARDCKNKKKEIICYLCKKSGHIASRCNSNVKFETKTVTIVELISEIYDKETNLMRLTSNYSVN